MKSWIELTPSYHDDIDDVARTAKELVSCSHLKLGSQYLFMPLGTSAGLSTAPSWSLSVASAHPRKVYPTY